MMKKITFILLVIFIKQAYCVSNILVEIPELNINNQVLLTNTSNLNPFSPCQNIPSTITCTDDPLNVEVTLLYPLTLTISNLGVGQEISFTVQANEIVGKEFKSFVIKKNNNSVSFPDIFSANQTVVYDIEIRMDYFGIQSLNEFNHFFRYIIETN